MRILNKKLYQKQITHYTGTDPFQNKEFVEAISLFQIPLQGLFIKEGEYIEIKRNHR